MIRYCRRPIKEAEEKKYEVWLRVGTTLQLTESELREIFSNGNTELLYRKLKNSEPDGEAYIPGVIVDDLVEEGLPEDVFDGADREGDDIVVQL